MSQGNTIQASFGVDLAPLKRDMTEAERIGRQGATRVAQAMNQSAIGATRAMGAFGNANPAGFGVPFGMTRAQRNSSAGFGPARPGQYPAPAEDAAASIGGRFSRGAGLLTIGYAVKRAVNFWQELVDAQVKISENIGRLKASQGSARGAGEIESNLSGIADQIEGINERKLRESQAGNGNLPLTPEGRAFAALNRTVRQALRGDSEEEDQRKLGVLREKAKQDLSDLTGKQEALNEVEDASLYGEERKAELLKEEIVHREKLKEIEDLQKRLGVNSQSQITAEDVRHAHVNTRINRRFDEEDMNKKAAADEEQFQNFQRINGDYVGYKQAQRDEKHARAVFDARKRDYAQRRANGAYGQSGPDSEVFGSNPSMDGWDKVVAVMREYWGKN